MLNKYPPLFSFLLMPGPNTPPCYSNVHMAESSYIDTGRTVSPPEPRDGLLLLVGEYVFLCFMHKSERLCVYVCECDFIGASLPFIRTSQPLQTFHFRDIYGSISDSLVYIQPVYFQPSL